MSYQNTDQGGYLSEVISQHSYSYNPSESDIDQDLHNQHTILEKHVQYLYRTIIIVIIK